MADDLDAALIRVLTGHAPVRDYGLTLAACCPRCGRRAAVLRVADPPADLCVRCADRRGRLLAPGAAQ